MFRQGLRARRRTTRPTPLLLVSKPPCPSRRGAGRRAPRATGGVAAFVGWAGRDAPYEIHPRSRRRRSRPPVARRRTSPPSSARSTPRRDASAGRACSGCSRAGRWPTRRATILEDALGPVAGNAGARRSTGGHAVLDLGEEEYTQGRPHPMVDLDLRARDDRGRGRRRRVGCLLLDVVLGHGAHPDPAGELAGAWARRAARDRVARVCGTAEDPQDARRQTAALEDAGAIVAPSNAAAARLAVRAVGMRPPLRIAMLTYSRAPARRGRARDRGAEALAGRGHEVELFALGPPGAAFFRAPGCRRRSSPTCRPSATSTRDRRDDRDLPRGPAPIRCATAASTSCTRRTASRPTPRSGCATRAWSTR